MEFRPLKQEMETVFAQLQEHSSAGELPPEGLCNQFLRLVRLMQPHAQDDWGEEFEDFLQMSVQLVHAVKKGLLQDAVGLVESIDDAKAYCHRSFK